MHYPTLFWPGSFLLRNLPLAFCGFPWMTRVSFLLLLPKFSIIDFEFITVYFLVESVWGFMSSCTWMSTSLHRSGKFSVVASLKSFLPLLSVLLRLPECKYCFIWWCSITHAGFLHCFPFFLFFFSDWIISKDLFKFTDYFFCLIMSIIDVLYCIFHIILFILQAQNLCLVLLL